MSLPQEIVQTIETFAFEAPLTSLVRKVAERQEQNAHELTMTFRLEEFRDPELACRIRRIPRWPRTSPARAGNRHHRRGGLSRQRHAIYRPGQRRRTRLLLDPDPRLRNQRSCPARALGCADGAGTGLRTDYRAPERLSNGKFRDQRFWNFRSTKKMVSLIQIAQVFQTFQIRNLCDQIVFLHQFCITNDNHHAFCRQSNLKSIWAHQEPRFRHRMKRSSWQAYQNTFSLDFEFENKFWNRDVQVARHRRRIVTERYRSFQESKRLRKNLTLFQEFNSFPAGRPARPPIERCGT